MVGHALWRQHNGTKGRRSCAMMSFHKRDREWCVTLSPLAAPSLRSGQGSGLTPRRVSQWAERSFPFVSLRASAPARRRDRTDFGREKSSASLAAINRALLVSWLCRESSLSRRGMGQAISHVPVHVLTRMLVPLKAGGINLLIFHGVYPCYNLNVGRCIY